MTKWGKAFLNADKHKIEFVTLMWAVGHLDAPMTDFFANGANPSYDDIGDGIKFGCGSWYIDDIDVALLHESFEKNTNRAWFVAGLEAVAALAKYGVTCSGSHCVAIDPMERSVSVRQASVVF